LRHIQNPIFSWGCKGKGVNLNTQTLEKEILPKKIKNWLNFSKTVADAAIYSRTCEIIQVGSIFSAIQMRNITKC
jgi:hypothetical protein